MVESDVERFLRLFVTFPRMSTTDRWGEIVPMGLPAALSFVIPVLPDARVLGSVIQGNYEVEVLLESDRQPCEILEYYRGHPEWSPAGIPSEGLDREVLRLHETEDPLLWVSVVNSGAIRLIKLSLLAAGQSLFSEGAEVEAEVEPDWPPKISFHDGCRVLSGGGAHNGSFAHFFVLMDCPKSPSEIQCRVSEQLIEIGWEVLDADGLEGLAWSHWRTGGGGDGHLIVVQCRGDGRGCLLFELHV